MDLIYAITIIQLKSGKKVTAIEYEDGSGRKFNYKLEGLTKWSFIDLTDDLIPDNQL